MGKSIDFVGMIILTELFKGKERFYTTPDGQVIPEKHLRFLGPARILEVGEQYVGGKILDYSDAPSGANCAVLGDKFRSGGAEVVALNYAQMPTDSDSEKEWTEVYSG